jgi:periplasmic protein CpxP/Spy
MKNHIKSLAVTAVAVTMLSLGVHQASAFAGCEGHRSHGGHMKMMTELGLSDQQQQQVKGIIEKAHSQSRPLFKQMKAERHAMRTLVQADTINEPAIRAEAAKIATLEADMAVQQAKTRQEIRKILTPEQAKQFKEIRNHKESRFHKPFSHEESSEK